MDGRRWGSRIAAFLTVVALWGCPPAEEAPDQVPGESPEDPPSAGEAGAADVTQAEATMVNERGENVGVVTFAPEDDAVRVRGIVYLPDVPPSNKGFHVHQTGECETPTFESAGGHFNPDGAPHGAPDDPPGERHAGDLGNVEAEEDGTIEIDLRDEMISLDEGENGIVGLALMIHAEEDDFESQPTGDAGGRVACGVIVR